MIKKTILMSINASWNILNFRLSLIAALQGRGYRVVALAPPDRYSEKLAAVGVEYEPIEMDKQGISPVRDLLLLWRYYRILRRINPDIYLGYTAKPNIYGSLAAHAHGIPVINNVSGLGTAFIRKDWLTRVVGALYKLAFRQSSLVFFQNDEDLGQFVRDGIVTPGKARLLPGSGVDLAHFTPSECASQQGAFTFLLIGRLRWEKGVSEYVAAARLVQRKMPETRFQLLGPLDVSNRAAVSRADIDRWVSGGPIDYLGEADDVRPFIAAADCVVLPSYREGLPRALLEGAAMAKPLIASDVPGCRAVVDHGTNGLLCAPRDPQALADAMLEIMDMPVARRIALGAAARAKVEAGFDEAVVIDRYQEAVASSLLPRKKHSRDRDATNSRRLIVSINSCWNFVNFRTGLIKALVAEGYDVIALAPRDEYCDRLEALGCRYLPVPLAGRGTSPIADFALFLSYLRIMRREKPRAFIGFTIKPNIYGSLAAHICGVPVINNIAGLGTSFLARDWLNRLVRALYRGVLARARVVFFQNPDDRSLFVRDGLVAKEIAHLLPGSGVDTVRFAPPSRPHLKPSGDFTFLMVARMLWAKGAEEFVDAAARVKRKVPGAQFMILGIIDEDSKGAVDRAIVERWVGEGTIDFVEAVDDVRPYMANADCVVLPTYYPEGTPRSLLEGAAMGKPLIATDVPGCREIVMDGVNGFLVAPMDPEMLSLAMIRMVDAPTEEVARMGAASRLRAEREFDEQIVIARYLSAVAEVTRPNI